MRYLKKSANLWHPQLMYRECGAAVPILLYRPVCFSEMALVASMQQKGFFIIFIWLSFKQSNIPSNKISDLQINPSSLSKLINSSKLSYD